MALVSFREILFPVPFQPVFTRYALHRVLSFSRLMFEYIVGCNVKKASPNAGEKDGSER
jgi:hypothetical protein